MSRQKEDITFDAKRALKELDPLIREIENYELERHDSHANQKRPEAYRLFWAYRRAIMIALEREVKRSEKLAKKIAQYNQTGQK